MSIGLVVIVTVKSSFFAGLIDSQLSDRTFKEVKMMMDSIEKSIAVERVCNGKKG